MKPILLILLFCVLAGCAGSLMAPATLTPLEVHGMIESDSVLVLDVRTEAEYESTTGHLENAILIPVQTLEARLGEMEQFRSRTIVAYCRSGGRSARAARLLAANNFRVFSMEGGIMKWNAGNLPVIMELVVPEPDSLLPVPTERQRAWQQLEYYGFLHFTVNTFTDKEWGYGDESEELFNPTAFDAEEIVTVARDAGMKGLILTCKHHDGFCLWPSAYTDHSVKNSPWRNGKGDVVKELSEACKRHGLKFGIYLSPWDRNHRDYGKPEYLTYYRNQLRELLTQYGEISEVWFDGANGGDGYYGGAREERFIDKATYYGWEETWKLVRKLQPNAVMFSDVGPDIRWVGNEDGFAGETCWSMYSPVGENGGPAAPGDTRYREGIEGHRDGRMWLPPECDVSIRPGWFYHASEDGSVKTPHRLFQLYLQSVGRNGSLLLNIPPTREGRIHKADSAALMGFKQLRDIAFEKNLAVSASVTSTNTRGENHHFSAGNLVDGNEKTLWATDDSVTNAAVTLDLSESTDVNCAVLREEIRLGQRVEEFTVEGQFGNDWKILFKGTTIGNKRIVTFPSSSVRSIRLTILRSKACPALTELELFHIPIDLISSPTP